MSNGNELLEDIENALAAARALGEGRYRRAESPASPPEEPEEWRGREWDAGEIRDARSTLAQLKQAIAAATPAVAKMKAGADTLDKAHAALVRGVQFSGRARDSAESLIGVEFPQKRPGQASAVSGESVFRGTEDGAQGLRSTADSLYNTFNDARGLAGSLTQSLGELTFAYQQLEKELKRHKG